MNVKESNCQSQLLFDFFEWLSWFSEHLIEICLENANISKQLNVAGSSFDKNTHYSEL